MTASTPLPRGANLALRRGLRGERLPVTEAVTLGRPVGLLFPSAVSGGRAAPKLNGPGARTPGPLSQRDTRTDPQAEEPKCPSQIVAPGR
jgi:hypothetical protein